MTPTELKKQIAFIKVLNGHINELRFDMVKLIKLRAESIQELLDEGYKPIEVARMLNIDVDKVEKLARYFDAKDSERSKIHTEEEGEEGSIPPW